MHILSSFLRINKESLYYVNAHFFKLSTTVYGVLSISIMMVKESAEFAVNCIMKGLKYLMALWAAIGIYCVLSLVYGATGIFAYRELVSAREYLWNNIKKLSNTNSELENIQNSLLYDTDAITVQARQLGYGYNDEKFIRIVGLGVNNKPDYYPGEILVMPEPVYISDKIIKICSLVSGLIVFFLMLIPQILRRELDK